MYIWCILHIVDILRIDVIECKEKSKRVGSQVLTTLDDDPSHYFRFGNKDVQSAHSECRINNSVSKYIDFS